MAEYLKKRQIFKEDLPANQIKYFPATSRYYINAQKMRIYLVLDEKLRLEFTKAVENKYKEFNPTNVRKAAMEAITDWVQKNIQIKEG